jgi:hypothetical protein
MDPITVGFDAVTALLSALSLFLSRLDTRRHGSIEPPDLKVSLLMLSQAFGAWKENAQYTNLVAQKWMTGDIEGDQAISMLLDAVEGQDSSILHVQFSLISKHEPEWRSLRHLLEIYGEELLTIIDNGIRNRGRLIEQLVRYLPSLRTLEPEMIEHALAKLDSTWREIDYSSMMINEYIRSKFPLADGG